MKVLLLIFINFLTFISMAQTENQKYIVTNKINDIETKIKKDNSLSLILMKNFIYEILTKETNNSSLLTQ